MKHITVEHMVYGGFRMNKNDGTKSNRVEKQERDLCSDHLMEIRAAVMQSPFFSEFSREPCEYLQRAQNESTVYSF